MSKQSPHNNTDEGLHRNSDMPINADKASYSGATNLRSAAVLIPLIHDQGEWHILFIRRADNQHDRHSGQVAFPGGAMDTADKQSALATALRETFEEIGVPSSSIQALHELSPYVTISNYSVAPIVGVLSWPVDFTLQKEEVSRVFTIPLNWLRDRGNFTLRPRNEIDKTENEDNLTRPHPIVVYEKYDGEVLWGATARMTLNFLHSLDNGDVLLPKV